MRTQKLLQLRLKLVLTLKLTRRRLEVVFCLLIRHLRNRAVMLKSYLLTTSLPFFFTSILYKLKKNVLSYQNGYTNQDYFAWYQSKKVIVQSLHMIH